MPICALSHRAFSSPVPIEEAQEKFEQAGLLPAEVIGLIIEEIDDERRSGHCGLSPSVMIPSTTCRREQAIKRFVPYVQDPLKIWAAISGRLWHGMLQKAQVPEGWRQEVPLPGPQHEGVEGVRRNPGGFYELELWPGVWVSGRVDRLGLDSNGLEVCDFKSQRYAKTDYGAKPEWALQLTTYARMYGKLEKVQVPGRLCVWRLYEGSYDLDRTFRKFNINLLGEEVWEGILKVWCQDFVGMLREVENATKTGDLDLVDDAIRAIPMEGEVKGMFNGKKCPEYCSCMKECWRIEGRAGVVF